MHTCTGVWEIYIYSFSTSVSTDHTKAGVSQSPTHRITKKGQNVSFRCDPISGHTRLYWYRQSLGQGPEFLIYFQNEVAPDKSGLPGDHFSVERPNGSYSVLKIQPVKQKDSAVYLCASSLATAEHCHLLPAHKPQRLSPPHRCPQRWTMAWLAPPSKGANAPEFRFFQQWEVRKWPWGCETDDAESS